MPDAQDVGREVRHRHGRVAAIAVAREGGSIALGKCTEGSITSRAPGIASAVARPPDGRTSGSAVPWMTVAGTSSSARYGVRS